MERSRLARRIRAFRKLKGLTQADLAEQLGVSISILGAIERGNRIPDNDILLRISRVLNVELAEIVQIEEG